MGNIKKKEEITKGKNQMRDLYKEPSESGLELR